MAASSSSTPPAEGAGAASFDAAAAAARATIGRAIEAACTRHLRDLPHPVDAAIRYALSGTGKRLRGVLVLEAFHAAGGRGDAAPLAAAVEIVHAYSLVHDDLPCMDDDDMRRGRPTVHRAYGVAAATRAGIAMVPLAAGVGADAADALGLGGAGRAVVVRELMQASGASGMIGGQLLDLDGEGGALTLAELERIHAGKTGALLVAAARLGGIGARAGHDAVEALGRYGAAIGLAFQIADDILDVTATSAQLGKTAGKDAASAKSTYPALLGLGEATRRAGLLVEHACATLRAAGLLTPGLERIARFTVHRPS